MSKDFDRWNKSKKKLNFKEVRTSFMEGQIWWCGAGTNIGHEIDGKHNTFERPFYILKKCSNTMFIGIPSSTVSKRGIFVHELNIQKWKFILNFSQVKSISAKRLLRRMVNVSEDKKKDINYKFIEYIK